MVLPVNTSAQPRGLKLMQRMDRLGMTSRGLANLAGVSRNTVAKARNGDASAATYGKLETALERFEHDTGADGPTGVVGIIEFPDGTRAIFRGPTPEEAAQAVAAFMAQQKTEGDQ